MKRSMLLALLAALIFIACKKDKSPAPDPLTTGTWKAYAVWGGPSPGDWQPVGDGQGMIFRNNGTYQMGIAIDTEVRLTGKWERVSDKPADVPAGATLIRLYPDAYVGIPSFLTITFTTADDITVTPYFLPADRPLINPIGPVKYRRH